VTSAPTSLCTPNSNCPALRDTTANVGPQFMPVVPNARPGSATYASTPQLPVTGQTANGGWLVDAAGHANGTVIPGGSWTFDLATRNSVAANTQVVIHLVVGAWVVTTSGSGGSATIASVDQTVIDPASSAAELGAGVTTSDGNNLAAGAQNTNVRRTLTVNSVSQVTLGSGQRLLVKLYGKKVQTTSKRLNGYLEFMVNGAPTCSPACSGLTPNVLHPAATDAPSVPTLVAPAASAWITSLPATNAFQATFSDPNESDTGQINFRVCGNASCTAGGDPLQSFNSPAGITNGANGSGTLTTTGISDGGTYYWQARAQDGAGAISAWSAGRQFCVDISAPTITGVSATNPNGAYGFGQVIHVQVGFSEPVTVTGTPQLSLAVGSPVAVNYTSGSGTSTLLFDYTVGAGATSADLDYTSTSALTLNGGTIKDAAGNDANRTLASPGAAGSLGANKDISLDSAAPTTTIQFPAADGLYDSDGWNGGSAGCTGAPASGICGTAADSGSAGVQKVELSLRDGTGNYYGGTSFNQPSETYLTATGTSTWSYGLLASKLTDGHSYTLHVKATDNVGNVESVQSRWFAYSSGDADLDGDGWADAADNCFHLPNPDQASNPCDAGIGQPLIAYGVEEDHDSFWDENQSSGGQLTVGGYGQNWTQNYYLSPNGRHFLSCRQGGARLMETGVAESAQTPITIWPSQYTACDRAIWIGSSTVLIQTLWSGTVNLVHHQLGGESSLLLTVTGSYPYGPTVTGVRIEQGPYHITYSNALDQVAFWAQGTCLATSQTTTAVYGFDLSEGSSSLHKIVGGDCTHPNRAAIRPVYAPNWKKSPADPNNQLAYVYTGDVTASPQSWDLYVSESGTGPGTQFTSLASTEGAYFGGLMYSPTGRHLSYCYYQPASSTRDLYIDETAIVTGLNQCAGGENMHQYAWSPDETTIAYLSNDCPSTYSCKLRLYNLRYGNGQTPPSGNNVQDLNTNRAFGIYTGIDWGGYRAAAAVPLEQTFGAAYAEPGFGPDEDGANTGTGSYSTQVVDASLPGPEGVAFSFERSYNAADPTPGELGPGWQHPYAASLTVLENEDVIARAGDGQQLRFDKQGGGSFVARAGGRSSLVKLASTYELKTNEQLTYVFTLAGKLTAIRDRNDRQLTLAYNGGTGLLETITDANGREVTVNHTGGKISSIVLPGSGPLDSRDVLYAYDASGRLQTVTDLRGQVWTYAYDGDSTRLASILDPNSHYVVRNTYDATGRLVEQRDALNELTSYGWDPLQQTATVTDHKGNVWTDVYSNNLLVRRSDPLGNTTRYEYDTDLNLVKQTDPLGHATTMSYDAAGNMLTRTVPAPLGYTETWTYNSRNDVVTYDNRRGFLTTSTYDGDGNLIKTVREGPAGQDRTVEYGRDPGTGLLISQTAPFVYVSETVPPRKTTLFGYDPATNDLTSVTTPLGNETTFSYDESGRLASKVTPRGNEVGADPDDYCTSFTYDDGDNKLTETDPLAHQTSWTYDPAGNLATLVDAAGKTWTYDYDDADRLVTVTAPAPNSGVSETVYDENGNVTAQIDPEGNRTSFGYDEANRKLWMVAPRGNEVGADPDDYKTLYGYDAAGNLTSETDPLGNQTLHAHDMLGR
jgi:YD repeat-containing protein